jgi:hypothetical protein
LLIDDLLHATAPKDMIVNQHYADWRLWVRALTFGLHV